MKAGVLQRKRIELEMAEEKISALIGDIYDAALDPALWPDVIGKATHLLPGMSGALFVKNVASTTGGVHYDDGGIDPYYKRIYFEEYIKLDPANAAHLLSEIGRPASIADILPYDEFVETRFYREWVRPQGIVDFLSAVLDKSPTSTAMFGIFRHERHGLIDEGARRRMQLIVPHIRRAVLIGRVIDIKSAESASLANTLDGISAAMFLVDARGQITHANAVGHAMLAEGDMLFAANGRLAATDKKANEALNDVFTLAGGGDEAVGIRGIALPLTRRDGSHYMAHVLPLTSGARRKAGLEYHAAAAVFVRATQLETPPAPEVIARLYGLTPSELRVLLAIFETGGVPDVAHALGIAEATAKTHLRRLFEKTGAKRQADLVKLVAGFSDPAR